MEIRNSFILAPGVGRKTEEKLWRNGVTHWDEIGNDAPLSQAKISRLEEFLGKAKRNLEVGNSLFFDEKLPGKSLWRTYRNFESDACFFDIETTGLDRKSNRVTTVSIHRGGETKTLVRGKDLTREKLIQELSRSSILVSFNGKRFDQPFLEHSFNLDIEKPHIDLIYPAKRLGFSGGLKKIEKQLGIDRELEDIDGREAVKLWKRYEKGDQEALDKLVKYNRYDAVNLQQLLETIHQRLTAEIFQPHTRK